MSGFELRAHHGLCIGFFRGRGYSESFVKNMAGVCAALRTSDPLLTLRCGADVLCGHCPHNDCGRCDSAEKVARYDRAVLRLTGLEDGAALRWSALRALVRTRILDAGRLREVCGDCQWYAICETCLKEMK